MAGSIRRKPMHQTVSKAHKAEFDRLHPRHKTVALTPRTLAEIQRKIEQERARFKGKKTTLFNEPRKKSSVVDIAGKPHKTAQEAKAVNIALILASLRKVSGAKGRNPPRK